MFDRPQGGTRAILVHLDLSAREAQESLDEFCDLAASVDVEVTSIIKGRRKVPDPKYFVGSGKAGEIRDHVVAEKVELVLFNHQLSPTQERNLEQLLKCRVVDRSSLILDIFALRASSFEGKLQVELAQLKHLSTRLVRGWTHLERQKGGIGLRGPGETQLETDRRLIGVRIKKLNKRLDKVRKQRELRRQTRRKAAVSTVSLVGYTNAGKSTLFNRLTGAGVYTADKLFATLDPTLRRVELPAVGQIILADTVGFIRHLPHDLVAAFRATLEETVEANLLLHVIDVHDDDRHAYMEQVNRVLKEIGAADIPQIEVYNKIDQVAAAAPRIDYDAAGRPRRIWLSAQTGEGVELLLQALAQYFLGVRSADDDNVAGQTSGPQINSAKKRGGGGLISQKLLLAADAGRLRSQLYAWGVVEDEAPLQSELAAESPAQGYLLTIMATSELLSFLEKQPGCRVISQPVVSKREIKLMGSA